MKHGESYLTETVTEIKQLVVTLTMLNKKLSKRVSELELQKGEWEEERENLKKQLENLQEDYSILKLAKAVKGETDGKDAKMQISKLMREIDQCVALIQSL